MLMFALQCLCIHPHLSRLSEANLTNEGWSRMMLLLLICHWLWMFGWTAKEKFIGSQNILLVQGLHNSYLGSVFYWLKSIIQLSTHSLLDLDNEFHHKRLSKVKTKCKTFCRHRAQFYSIDGQEWFNLVSTASVWWWISIAACGCGWLPCEHFENCPHLAPVCLYINLSESLSYSRC